MDTGESHLLCENFLPKNETAQRFKKIIFAVCDYRLRLILVGESTVGKTSLIRSSEADTDICLRITALFQPSEPLTFRGCKRENKIPLKVFDKREL